MEVKGLVWLGTATPNFDAMVRFGKNVLKLRVDMETADNVVFALPNGDRFEVFRPAARPHFSTGPVGEFWVDDVETARVEMEAAGIEFLNPVGKWEGSIWTHFRGPDGNVYGLTNGPLPAQA